MIAFFANIFGYVLNFFYELVGNYGIAIILFCLAIKIIMLPLSIKQQKSLKKNYKLQNEMKQIQFKYKNDPEKLNQATIELYKREKLSPFSGCLSAIIQLVLLFSVFYMVKEPLTYVKKIDTEAINFYVNVLTENNLTQGNAYSGAYQEIAVINQADKIKEIEENKVAEGQEQSEQEKKAIENIDELYINMNFLGIDLSKVPTQSLNDYRVYIIPVLYVISSFISMRFATSMQKQASKMNDPIELNAEGDNKDQKEEKEEIDPLAQANKNMSLIMPIMSIAISLIAPLGLALYWLMNNILMIIEKLILNKVLKNEEE